MYKNKSIVAVVPCHNEETQIENVILTMPDFIDRIVTIDDLSSDKTIEVIKKSQEVNEKVVLLRHAVNQGVGGAIATGYKWCRDNDFDVAVVMAGDGQMDPVDIPAIIDPVVNDEADYSKGNRLFSGEAFKTIPKIRYFGNSILSLLTKIASGYWHIADSQSGYTAINKEALQAIDWDKMYKRYGQPNDLLVTLNVFNFRVRDVHVDPVYNVGEKSGIKIKKVVFSIGWLLLKKFVWRMKEKYIIRDFHPLVLFYIAAFFLGGLSLLFFTRIVVLMILRDFYIPPINTLAFIFTFISSSQFLLFAMWFDMENNKELK